MKRDGVLHCNLIPMPKERIVATAAGTVSCRAPALLFRLNAFFFLHFEAMSQFVCHVHTARLNAQSNRCSSTGNLPLG